MVPLPDPPPSLQKNRPPLQRGIPPEKSGSERHSKGAETLEAEMELAINREVKMESAVLFERRERERERFEIEMKSQATI